MPTDLFNNRIRVSKTSYILYIIRLLICDVVRVTVVHLGYWMMCLESRMHDHLDPIQQNQCTLCPLLNLRNQYGLVMIFTSCKF